MASRVISAVLSLKDRDFVSNLRRSGRELSDFERQVLQTRGDIQKFQRSSVASVKAVTTAFAGLAAVGIVSFGASVVSAAMEMDSAFSRLEAKTGIAGAELKGLETVAQNVFKNGFGENITQVTDDVATLSSTFSDLSKGELQKVAEGAFTISSLWETEAKEVGKAVSTMTKTFDGLGETQALDLITTAFQRTGDMSDDLLDTFNEYSTQFKALGYDAEGFTATLIAGAESGAFNFDKLADTAKEGFLKLGEGSKDTTAALKEMGLDANQITSDIGAGGEKAQQAFMAVSTAIGTIKDPAEQNAAAIAAFGTPLEDLGPQFNTFFSSVNQDLGNFEGATQKAADAMQNNFGTKMTKVWRDVQIGVTDAFREAGGTEFLDGIAAKAEELVPKVESIVKSFIDFGKSIKDNWSTIENVLVGVGTFVGVLGAVKLGIAAVTAAQWLWNVAMSANPIGLIVIGVAALIAIGVVLWKNFDTIKAKAMGLWQKLLDNPMAAIVAGPIGALIAGGILLYKNFDKIKAKAGELWTSVTTHFTNLKTNVVKSFTEMKDGAVNKFNEIVTSATELPGKIGKGIKDFAKDAWEGIKDLAEGLVKKFKAVLGIKSPSRVFYDMAGWIVKGLTNGLSAENLKSLGTNVFKDFAGGALNTLSMIKGFLSGGGSAPNVSGGASAWRSMIVQAAATMGETLTDAEINGIIAQIHRESRGNQKIVQSPLVNDINMKNGNPAQGLLQYIPQTFANYKVKGHGNIKNGYDQLLAFFNNTNWRKDLPYGRRGWGPTGARKFAKGGFINREINNATIGEAGREVIIPLEQHRNRAVGLWEQTGKEIGAFERYSGGNKTNNITININGADKSVNEILNELVPQLKLRLANL